MSIRKLVSGFAAVLCGAFAVQAAEPTITPVSGYEILEYLESSGTQYIDSAEGGFVAGPELQEEGPGGFVIFVR